MGERPYKTFPDARNRGGFNLEYQPYYRTNGMFAEKISKFEEVLTRKARAATDPRAAAKTLILANEDPAIKAEAARRESAFAAELKAPLSSDEFAELK